jgi:hypothetical protein
LVPSKRWEELIESFTNTDCPGKKFYSYLDYKMAQKEKYETHSLCDAALREGLLNVLGEMNTFPRQMFVYMRNNVYRPLAYKIRELDSFSEQIKRTVYMTEDDSMINQNMMIPHNNEYKNNIMEAFKNIEHYSTNFEDNKPQISDAIMDLLKKFHIYWNVKRRRNEMDQVKENTLDIIKSIINQYKDSEKNMRLTTLNILTNIRDAYFRFFRADKLLTVLKDQPVEQITVQILRRYKDNVDKIRMHESSYKTMITEVGYILELCLAFWKVNFTQGIVDKQNEERFRFAVYDKIKEIYLDYQKYMVETGDQKYNDVKDFTVLLLSKLEVKMHKIFQIYSFQGYNGQPMIPVENELYSAAELYFRLMDQLVIVPERCLDLHVNDIKVCLTSELSKILNNFYFDYWMFTSVNGAQLFDFIRIGMSAIIEEMDQAHEWDNAINWKNKYFAELFKFDEVFRMKYYIKKVYELDDLMNTIGYIIERQKGLQIMAKDHFKLLDKLDTDIYELFIKLKADYNQFDPLNKHIDILNKIKTRIHHFLQKFIEPFHGKIGKRVKHLLNDVSRAVEKWYRDHCVKYVINTSPNNKITALDSVVPVPSHPGTMMQQVYHEPVVMSGATYPIGMGMGALSEGADTPNEAVAANNEILQADSESGKHR